MPVDSCPECNGKMSTEAVACPHCGYRPQRQPVAGEEYFFQEGGVVVTRQRFILPHQTYAVSQITSVRAATEWPSITGAVIALILGIPALLAGAILALAGMADKSRAGQECGLALGCAPLLFGIPLTALGVFFIATRKPTYWVIITTSGGEARALGLRNLDFIQNVVEALNRAIIARG